MTFKEFYVWYQQQHSTAECKLLHALGALLAVIWASSAYAAHCHLAIPFAIPVAYLTAWIGHLYEGNQPASLRHPLYSAAAYFVMLRDIITKG
jgi:hypothetical protein